MSEGDGRLFKAHLPNTGEQDHLGQIFTATSLGIIAGLGLMVKDKKEDLS
ncbi:TPA: LPXTG cell wall anchor domain-containing protein [Streptococcus suis]